MKRDKIKNAKYQHDWWIKNKEKQQDKVKKNRARIRKFVEDIKKKSSCSSCGFSNYKSLQFHHTDKGSKDFSISEMYRKGMKIERVQEEIDKCIILCANCHSSLHYVPIDAPAD